MLTTKSLDLWQEGELDPDTGLPFKRPVLVPDDLAAHIKKRKKLLSRIKTLFSRLKTSFRRTSPDDHMQSSQRTAEQHSSFRRSMIASALLEKEHTQFKPPNKLANVLCGPPAPNQVVWGKERSSMTEGHPVLRANPNVYIPSEYDEAVHWALGKVFSPNDSRLSLLSSFGQ